MEQNARSPWDMIHSLAECSLPRAYLLFNAYREFKSGTSGCFFYKRNAYTFYHQGHQCMIPVTRRLFLYPGSSLFKQNEWPCRLSLLYHIIFDVKNFDMVNQQTCASVFLVNKFKFYDVCKSFLSIFLPQPNAMVEIAFFKITSYIFQP